MSMRAEASFLMAVAVASPAAAGCVCVCENGRNRPVCESAVDYLPAVCPPKPCAIDPAPITSLPGARLRSLGTAACALTRVHDQATGDFKWVRLCN